MALSLSPMPVLLDDMKDTAGKAYAAHPDRLFLVGKDGRISFAGDRGPMGFQPDLLEDAIRQDLGLEPIERAAPEQRGRRRDR